MITFEKLFKAYRDCCKHKRGKNSQITFEFNQERNLVELYAELTEGRYIPDYSICFIVIFPKVREVWAANFRDRIVHHLIYNEIKDRFYNRFTIDTFSDSAYTVNAFNEGWLAGWRKNGWKNTRAKSPADSNRMHTI